MRWAQISSLALTFTIYGIWGRGSGPGRLPDPAATVAFCALSRRRSLVDYSLLSTPTWCSEQTLCHRLASSTLTTSVATRIVVQIECPPLPLLDPYVCVTRMCDHGVCERLVAIMKCLIIVRAPEVGRPSTETQAIVVFSIVHVISIWSVRPCDMADEISGCLVFVLSYKSMYISGSVRGVETLARTMRTSGEPQELHETPTEDYQHRLSQPLTCSYAGVNSLQEIRCRLARRGFKLSSSYPPIKATTASSYR